MVIGLSDGEVAYFELDDEGKLDEVAKKTLGSDIASIDLPDVRTLVVLLLVYICRCQFAMLGVL